MSEHILYEVNDSIAQLTLNRPKKLNAITGEMAAQIETICRDLDRDDKVAVVLLSGVGERAFCAGSDLHSLGGYQTIWHYRDRVEYATAIRNIRKPVIVALKGGSWAAVWKWPWQRISAFQAGARILVRRKPQEDGSASLSFCHD